MRTLFWICFIFMPICYAYLVIYGVKDIIVTKLTNLYIYTDPYFARSKYTRGDWDSLNHSKFIRKAPILFALMKEGLMIITMPFMASLFSVFLFGIMPANSKVESDINLKLLILTIGIYYFFAILAIIHHRLSFARYKDKAVMEKNLWEAKSIIANK